MFGALAEPNRRAILSLLLDGDQSAGSIGAEFTLAQPTVSKHLKVLREAGLVTVRHQAQQRWYHLEPERLQPLDEWMEPYRRRWNQQLDALAHHLDTMPD